MANFVSSLWGTTNTGRGWLTNLSFTVPPPSSGGNFQFNISGVAGVTVSIPSPPSGWTWSSPVLTVPSTFSGTQSVSLSLAGGNVSEATFSVTTSGGPQTGTSSSFTVNEDGWMSVQSLGTNVTFNGFFTLIQNIPSGGQVQLDDPVLMFPTVSGSPDFSFTVNVGNGLSGGTLTLSSSSSSQVSVSVNNNVGTATAQSGQSGLAAGSEATVTAKYTTTTTTTTSTFTVQRLSSGSVSSGGPSSTLSLNSDGTFTVTVLATNVYLRGTSLEYETTAAGTYDLMFYTNTSGLNFSGTSPVTFSDTTVPGAFGSSEPATGVVQISSTNTGINSSTEFTIATSMGVMDDPTIINNPDTTT